MSAGLASAENVRFLYDEMRQTLWKWRKGNTSARMAMLAQGLNPDLRDEFGQSLIMFSTRECDLETIKELVERGASLKARTSGGDNVIMYGMVSLGTEWESPQCLPV
ncbi:MAG: hypothetical protein KDK23_14015, partial [Leptospiraceae bacterium]|nr:hypothetical protein [Leptospiraceae bacterium]